MNDAINNRVASLTSLVLAAFVAYIAAWYLGWVEGNFALMLLLYRPLRTALRTAKKQIHG